ncbi:ATP-binding protein [Geothermobacter hydrogeniphilus]|uniref:histidine kinase n=1 Tax=Geothermobacter hydrogeniphilus TaxID=1969733 RepID=A0A1X0XLE7_9BACT|nr:ATP-binding protein [Geothermobacter hydrogeniphilus]ORJ53710.1 hypothetical protein B5V00_16025 [Geothermobacter hydrogeniphilus]
MKSTLEKRILLFAFLVLTLTIAANTILTIDGFRRDYRDGLILRSRSIAESLKISIENLLEQGAQLSAARSLADRCSSIVNTDPEIAYCLVEDAVGKPVFASDPAFVFGPKVKMISAMDKSTALLQFGNRQRYYDVSVNLFSDRDILSGRVRIGFPETVLKERIKSILQRSLIVLAGAFTVVFTLVFLFVRRDLIGPITTLSTVAKEIAGGRFDVAVPELTTRDFSELGDALRHMAQSLKERDAKIQQSYGDLKQTNQQLQDSYENLERVGAELGRSREMYRSLLDDASDAILVSDEQDRIVLINKAAERFFGNRRQEVGGTNLYSFLEQLQVSNIDELYRLHGEVLDGNTLEAEIRFMSPVENRPVVGWVKASPVVGRDGRRRVQSIIRDVTREREIKENLQRSTAELKRLNQMKDSFLGVASHELKTPLTVIIGYTELLMNEWQDRLEPPVMGMLEHIANAADRLSNIVRDMVDVSMLEDRRMKLRMREVDINPVVEQAARELEFFFDRRGQHLSLDLQQELPPVLCDPDRIAQVIGNLVGNAIKFTPDGGRIEVATRLYYCRRQRSDVSTSGNPEVTDGSFCPLAEEKQPYLLLSIRDNGIGIDSADLPHVFDKFYEVGNIEEHFTGKVAFKGKGTGLGLTIVKGIVDLHGGAIWVESSGNDPERCPGCLFQVILPVVEDVPSPQG